MAARCARRAFNSARHSRLACQTISAASQNRVLSLTISPFSRAKRTRWCPTLISFASTACVFPLALSVTSACLFALTIPAQQAPSSQRAAITLDGNIRDESGKAVSAATVSVTATGGTRIVKTKSNADGSFRLILTEAGTFRIEAEKTGVGKAAVEASQLKLGDARRCDLVLSS